MSNYGVEKRSGKDERLQHKLINEQISKEKS